MTIAALINPNTDPSVTRRMLAVARATAPAGLDFVAITADRGVSLITNETQLEEASRAVEALTPRLSEVDGAIVAAFGDPGLEQLRATLLRPVVGIGESALREAAGEGRRFAVATTTPALVTSIEHAVARLGLQAAFAGVFLTRGDAQTVTATPTLLLAELDAAVGRAVDAGNIEAIVIGGGPLADAARHLSKSWGITIVEPVPSAVRRLSELLARSVSERSSGLA